ncbi:hypothetical protein Acid345_3167 [Candidatus Koribacter versatilis Ellin345]|uniref:Uncharacterized protein n=1 Tax=Koribacter versatilis (strain Ellin345) TaxID=204669 RepID=Q1ILT2_KORVE|nr:hypothetical protein [Candidatus Koribacter versatilis]ABF42168.1 hypothetical protein Acid345_3167 [Candidatus Koribacter versatilis Ellin345]
MSRTAIAVQTIPDNTAAAVTLSASDSSNNMIFPNDGRTEIIVKNANGSSVTVTAVSVPCEHGRTGDIALVIANGAIASFPKLSPALFNQQSGADIGQVYLNFSISSSITVGAVKRGS